MRRLRPIPVPIGIAVLATVLLTWPFSESYWTSYLYDGPSAETQGDPTYISAPGSDLIGHRFLYGRFGIEDPASFVEALFAVMIAIAIYVLISRHLGPRYSRDTLCRRCRSVLRGLSEAKCPTCGEPI